MLSSKCLAFNEYLLFAILQRVKTDLDLKRLLESPSSGSAC